MSDDLISHEGTAPAQASPALVRHSLKTKITLTSLGIFVLSLWSLALYAESLMRERLEQSLSAQQFSTVSLLAAEINRELDSRIALLQSVASRISQQELQSTRLVESLLEDKPGLQLMFNGGLAIAKTDGTVIADLPDVPGSVSATFRDSGDFQDLFGKSEVAIGKPVLSKLTQEPSVVVAVPIRSPENQVLGSLAGIINLAKPNILDQIGSLSHGKTGDYLIISPAPRVIVSATDKSRILEELPAPGASAQLDRALNGVDGSAIFTTRRGVEVLASIKRVPTAGWYVALMLPTAQAYASIREVRDRVVVAAGLLTLLAAGLSWWLLRRQFAPLHAATATLAAQSKLGVPLQPLPLHAKDEIGDLVAAFNFVLQTLRLREQALTANEERWQFAVDGAGDGAWDWNLQTGKSTYSRRWKEMIGYAEDEIGHEASEWLGRVHPDDLRSVNGAIQAHLEGKTPKAVSEFRMLCKDGSWKWILGRGMVAGRDAQGKPQRLAGTNTDISQRKQAEQALKEQEAFTRSVIDSVTDEVVVIDRDGTILAVNSIWRQAAIEGRSRLGVDQALVDIGDNYFDACRSPAADPADHSGVEAAEGIRAVLEGRLPSFSVESPRHSASQSRWYRMRVSPLGHDLRGAVITHTNVTEQRLATEALRLSEERHRLLADNASDVIWMADLTGRFTYVSPSILRISGFTSAQAMQIPMQQVLNSESGRKAMQAFETITAAMARGQEVPDFRGDVELARKDGSTIWTETSACALRAAQGGTVGILGVTRDISDRKNAEARLLLANTVFDNALEGISITDAQGNIVNVNPAFTRITGYSREEAIGNNPRILKSGRQTQAFYEAMWHDLGTVGHWSGEIWNRRKDGVVYPESLAISAARDANGRTQHYVAIFSDITLRKEAEQKVHHQAMFDTLTGLPNRSLLFDHLNLSLAASKRRSSHGGLLFLDLDNFKPLNDTHGHEAGDLLLIEVARRLSASVREVDTVARFGGDEFVVLLNDLGDDRAGAVKFLEGIAEKIRKALALPYRILTESQGGFNTTIEHRCSASIGGVTFFDHATRQDELIKRADLAMYKAKSDGGNTVRLHEEPDQGPGRR